MNKKAIKIVSIIALILVPHSKVFSQDLDSIVQKNMYIGFGVGPETGISGILPKISYYKFQDRVKFESYYGFEGSIWVVGAPMLSGDILYGIKKNVFTIDNSIGLWWYPKTESTEYYNSSGPYFHCTLNPKIGIKFWKLWFKAGPSIILFKDYTNIGEKTQILDITKLGNVYYNFEILIKF